jgi:hypothetical protein
MWWIALQLGYSGTYLPDMPPIIQEPLVDALARIAQWRGKDQELQKFFGPEPEALTAKVRHGGSSEERVAGSE